MKRTKTILMTTVMLSIALTSVFAINFDITSNSLESSQALPPFFAEADTDTGIHHTIKMQAVKMPDGMYAYQMLEYTTSDGKDLVIHPDNPIPTNGVYSTKPSIPGPTLIFEEGDTVSLTLRNNACDDFVIGEAGENENSLVGIHVHGVHYDVGDDATYDRVNMNGNSAASCNEEFTYHWHASAGTAGTWPYHDHTFKQNEVGAEDIGLFGTVIVNPTSGSVNGLVEGDGDLESVLVSEIDKEFVLWMVSSEVLGRSVFYGMEIDNKHPSNPGKQTNLWINPPLYTEEGKNVRFHVLGLGDEVHSFHLHGHRWIDTTGGAADIIDVKEIAPLQRHTFVVEVSSNDGADETSGTESWMYHCHVFDHMQAGMSGMMNVVDDDTLPDIGAVFTLSDEPGLWMKTLNAGIADDLDKVLDDLVTPVLGLEEDDIITRNGTGYPLDYLGVLSEGWADTQGRSLAIISPGESVLFNMKDSQTKHTITTLIYPEEADSLGGNGAVTSVAGLGHFDTQLGIRGSTLLTDPTDTELVGLETPGLYVFVCKIHPYMFSAVIVDDPTTYTHSNALGADLPLLDLVSDSGRLEILSRYENDTGTVTFPTNVGPASSLPTSLLKTFFVITDPSNWKDYTQDEWAVNLPPALLTTNNNSTVVAVMHPDAVNTTATLLQLENVEPGSGGNFTAVLGLNLDSVMEITDDDREPPSDEGIGEVWVNTQFERTVNKNHEGTPYDKPGTITVVDAETWEIERKIALPEINMNHPHNMWASAKQDVVYQTQWFDSRMVAIDRESGEMIKDVFVGQSPSHVMTSPDTGKIYIAVNGEEQVTELDPDTYETTRQISTGFRSHPHGHWISSSGEYLVTPNFLSLSASIVNLEDNTVTNTGVASLLGPIATGMLGDESKFFTADFLGNSLSPIDTDGNIDTFIDLLEVKAGLPIQTPVSPDDRWMVTANVLGPEGSAITVVDVGSHEIVQTLPCDPGCHGVQWGAKEGGGYYAYVSNKFSNALIVVDPKEGTDAEVVGKIILTEEPGTTIDDRIIGYDGMGGQGVLAIPNVYEGWIQETVDLCSSNGNNPGPCGKEVRNFVRGLDNDQKDPLG
jgi:DNA-binding beta-propeller fold protein YncE/plastocyanin